MFNLVQNYYPVIMGAAAVLFLLTLFMRIKLAKVKKDKVLYNVYSVLTGLVAVSLVLYKVL